MLTFAYEAKETATGKKVQSQITADSEQSAAKALRQQGLVPLEIRPVDSDSLFSLDHYLKRISTKDKVLFSRQLATLINAGLPLVQSLRNVASQTTNKQFRIIINNVITDVESGKSLSKALSNYSKVFDVVFVNLVAAGETSGTRDGERHRLRARLCARRLARPFGGGCVGSRGHFCVHQIRGHRLQVQDASNCHAPSRHGYR